MKDMLTFPVYSGIYLNFLDQGERINKDHFLVGLPTFYLQLPLILVNQHLYALNNRMYKQKVEVKHVLIICSVISKYYFGWYKQILLEIGTV